MEVRYSPDAKAFQKMTTSELRESFLVANLFETDKVILVYSDVDRAIVGSAVPSKGSLKLEASKKEMAADYFAERREVGIINIGDPGLVQVDGQKFQMDNKDCLYIGRGSKEIEFSSNNGNNPAKFYILSYPAHMDYPTKLAKKADATPVKLGDAQNSNKRTIYKCIYPGGIESCQLVLGFTSLEEGSVWNTMPVHTHQRRMEVYMYFDLPEDGIVCHLMGKPEETKHLIVRDGQAVISPSWSIHTGAGTSNYTFVWGMGGENQDFDDMDWIQMDRLA